MTRHGWLLLCFGMFAWACEDPPARKTTQPAAETATPAPAKEPAKPSGPPELAVDGIGAKVGFNRANLDNPEGLGNLRAELEKQREFLASKPSTLIVDRNAKLVHVGMYLNELAKLGSKPVTVKTETRKDFPPEVTFTPEAEVGTVPACSVVAIVMEDRGTAVWKLSGGVAGKRSKGMAGPDLTMTGDTIERLAKACEQSRTFFVSAAPGLEWGLAYDLAASTKTLPKSYFDSVVFLPEAPVPGHKVDLKR